VKPTAAAGPRAGATFRVTANSTLLGIVLRDMAPPLLMECIRAVHAGGAWVERKTVSRAL
jgi:hypothetical protein